MTRGIIPNRSALPTRFRAVAILLLLAAGCRESAKPPSAPPSGPSAEPASRPATRAAKPTDATPPASTSAAISPPLFTDAAADWGVTFTYEADAKGAFRIPEEMGPGAAFFDYDDDGDMDLYLVQGGVLQGDCSAFRNRLYSNDGQGHFTDVSGGSGADIPGYGMGVAAADYDNDGDVDLYVTRVGTSVLLRNEGQGKFADATAEAGVGNEGLATAAAFFDYDRDGRLDLVVLNYLLWPDRIDGTCWVAAGIPDYCGPMAYQAAPNRLYHNEGGGRFNDVTAAAGLVERGKGLGLATCDFDNDGWIDLYVANDQVPAFLYMNQRNGKFKENALLAGCAYSADGRAIAGMGVDTADLDGDGDYDLIVTNIRGQPHLCLRNDGGMFEDVSHAWGFGSWSVPYTGFGIALFDQNCDGRLEGFIANGAVNRYGEPYRADNVYAEPNQFIRRDDSGRFRDASAEAGPPLTSIEMSRGVLVGDCDGDGDIDVLVTNNRGPLQLLRNEAPQRGHWVVLDLVDRTGGRNALNARVTIRAGGQVQRREVRPHSSYLCSNDPRLHFGLGAATQIDEIEVRWLDGGRDSWKNVPADGLVKLTEGHSPGFQNPPAASPAATNPSAAPPAGSASP